MTQKKQQEKGELICIGDYSLEFRSWYKNGKLKKECKPKDIYSDWEISLEIRKLVLGKEEEES